MGTIYHGPAVRVEIGDLVLGALGQNNAELNFEPKNAEVGDGQDVMLCGIGSIKIETAESNAAVISDLASKRNTLQLVRVYTEYNASDNYTRFATGYIMINYAVKRGFGDEPHIITISGKRFFEDEDDFADLETASGGGT